MRTTNLLFLLLSEYGSDVTERRRSEQIRASLRGSRVHRGGVTACDWRSQLFAGAYHAP
jgi:hypothetical protein